MPIEFVGGNFIVNSTAQNTQYNPYISIISDNRIIITWNSDDTGDGSGGCTRARIFSFNGEPLGDDFIVNSTRNKGTQNPTATSLSDGNFVITWRSDDTFDGSSSCIRARIFSSDGAPNGPDFIVNSTSEGFQFFPSITSLSAGHFLVTWTSDDDGDGDGHCIRARIFDSNGISTGDDFIVNTTTSGGQFSSRTTTLDNGNFLVTWESSDQEWSVFGRIFDANGVAIGDDFLVNSNADLNFSPKITATNDGGFVAVWQVWSSDAELVKVVARAFDPAGKATSDEFLVNSTEMNDGHYPFPSIDTLPDGRIVAVWSSNEPNAGGVYSIRARILDVDGTPSGSDFVVNSVKPSDVEIRALNDGRFIVSWRSQEAGDGSLACIRAQIFDSTIFNGTSAADSWRGSNVFADKIYGGAGDDTLVGLGGKDTLSGGDGNDVLNGGLGADYVSGGTGTDTASYATATAGLKVSLTEPSLNTGDAKGDTFNSIENLEGSAFNDTFDGNAAANTLSGLAGNDILRGAAGTDTLLGGAGDDTLGGGDGNDTLRGGLGADYLSGGAGTDTASYAHATAAVKVSLADPSLNVGEAKGDTFNSIENLEGSAFNDTLDGNAGTNVLTGNDGLDLLRGAAGNDTLRGGGGNDTLGGGDGNDLLSGGIGADYLSGGSGTDTASYASAAAGVTVGLAAPAGNTGEAAGDTFNSVENLEGSGFGDRLSGNSAANAISGLNGADVIDGGAGSDTLTGGGGKDYFVFTSTLGPTNIDIITDFSAADDTIRLDNAIFAAVGATGALASGYFRANATGTAQDANDRILYETDTGKLFYDADGNGAGAAIHFATLTGNPTITAADFQVI
ncbi:calcium-binding protein [Mesorhizobium sp. ASY16-5R]|uniref:calcium-binding protein n=1 Tax=Mesorhizobium sp. ASY16-5R TaxID=3445772 RepID=UPI003FA03E2D